jgi:hypothetical protein
MFFELREYRIRDGRRDEFARLMDETIIPFQHKMGMTIIGSFISLDEDDLYVWIRRFESEDERARLYDAVYGSPFWKNDIRAAMGDMLIRETIKVRLLAATPLAAMTWGETASSETS